MGVSIHLSRTEGSTPELLVRSVEYGLIWMGLLLFAATGAAVTLGRWL
ncbi:MAG: hypothetical protein ACE5HL_12820 [Terriglobia bacterium]